MASTKSTGNIEDLIHTHTQRGAISVWTAAGATFTGSLVNIGTEWEERLRKGKMNREREVRLTRREGWER